MYYQKIIARPVWDKFLGVGGIRSLEGCAKIKSGEVLCDMIWLIINFLYQKYFSSPCLLVKARKWFWRFPRCTDCSLVAHCRVYFLCRCSCRRRSDLWAARHTASPPAETSSGLAAASSVCSSSSCSPLRCATSHSTLERCGSTGRQTTSVLPSSAPSSLLSHFSSPTVTLPSIHSCTPSCPGTSRRVWRSYGCAVAAGKEAGEGGPPITTIPLSTASPRRDPWPISTTNASRTDDKGFSKFGLRTSSHLRPVVPRFRRLVLKTAMILLFLNWIFP